MRIIEWNLGHRAVKRGIPRGLVPALVEAFDNPDAIVLTEYVESNDPGRRDFVRNGLIANGFRLANIHTTPYVKGNNSVLIATRMPSTRVAAPVGAPTTHAASNYLHVWISEFHIDLVGFRTAADIGGSGEHKRKYWEWLAQSINSIKSSRVIAIGDFNFDPEAPPTRKAGEYFKALFPTTKWQLPKPTGIGASYWGVSHTLETPMSSRLDHAFVSMDLANPVAAYAAEYMDKLNARIIFGGALRAGSQAMSDHAVLVLDVDVRQRLKTEVGRQRN